MSMREVRGNLPDIIASEKRHHPDVIINVRCSDPVNGHGITHWNIYFEESDYAAKTSAQIWIVPVFCNWPIGSVRDDLTEHLGV